MKQSFIIVCLLIQNILLAQNAIILTQPVQGEVNRRISSDLPEGTRITITGFSTTFEGHGAIVKANGITETVSLNRLDRIDFQATGLNDFWIVKALNQGVYKNLLENGFQYDIRNEIDNDVIEYMEYLGSANMFFYDDYLESYMYSLIRRLYPNRIIENRPGNLNVRIIKDMYPNAAVYPNGAMIITTGLLSIINSEEELLAILAHEIAHYVLDHSIININQAEKRQRRAEFWAGLATGLAAATDIYMATQSDRSSYYIPGALTFATASVAYSIANQVNERLGINYSRQQEVVADVAARKLLSMIDIDPVALSSVLRRIYEYNIITGNYLALSGGRTHPPLRSRITGTTDSEKFLSVDYDRKISFVNSFTAIQLYNNRHFDAAHDIIQRNIDAGVAVEDDYVLMSKLYMFMYDDEDKNQKALEYLNTAKSLNVYHTINLHKQEALIMLRLGDNKAAETSLLNYRQSITEEKERIQNILSPGWWAAANRYLSQEYEWASKMIGKVDRL